MIPAGMPGLHVREDVLSAGDLLLDLDDESLGQGLRLGLGVLDPIVESLEDVDGELAAGTTG
jgi:hypothetical protein